MAIPAGISTALVHLDAPVSFIGDPGQLHVTIKSSVPLVWAATGTPVANFIDNINPGEGVDLSVELPHTDQDGFVDGNGNAFKGWSYVVEITYEKSGEQVQFPTREFQIPAGQTDVDLALVPSGESYVPVVAPILPVTSIGGFNGAVTLAQLSLDLVDNTRDADKPVSTAAQAALDTKADGAAMTAALGNKSDVGHRHGNATAATDGFMAAADKAKLDGAAVAEVGGALVVRDADGNFAAGTISLSDAPAGPDSAARRDYVDDKVAGVTYGTLGVVPTSSLPPLAISEPFVVASQAAMLALVAQRGDVAIRTDIGRSYILASDSPSTLADWKMLTAAGDVVSVAGRTGSVVLAKADVGLTNVDNTSDVNKPVSTAQQSALDAKLSKTEASTTYATKTQVAADIAAGASDPVQPWKDAVQAQKTSPAIWVNLGDSIANGGNATTWSRNWLWRATVRYTDRLPNRLDDTTLVAAPATGVAVYTGAVGGKRSLDYLTDALVTRIGTLQPKLITHIVGTNDYGNAVAPATYKANLRAWYDKIVAAAPNAAHVFIHAPERLDGVANAYKWSDYRDQLLTLKAEINSPKVTVFDVDAELRKYGPAGTSDRYKLWDADNLHFKDKGNKVLADLIAKFIGAPPVDYLPRELERGLTKPPTTVTTNTTVSSFVVKPKPYLREGVIKANTYVQATGGNGDLILAYGPTGQADTDYQSFRISATMMNYPLEMFAAFEPNTEYTVKLVTENYGASTFTFGTNAKFFYFAADVSPA